MLLLEMPGNIDEIEFTIFDTETTGLSPLAGDRIVELAGLRIKGAQSIAVFDELINPGREISAGAFAVNKITPLMLKDAPNMATVMPKFLEFIQGSCLCCYNAEFDLGFLNQELKLLSYPVITDFVIIDLLIMARKLLPGLARYPLWLVAKELGVSTTQKHRAAADVEMTREVFNQLKIICQQKNITDFTNFTKLFAFVLH